MRLLNPLLAAAMILTACSNRQINDGGGGADELGDATLEWSSCAMKGEVQTCAEVCATQGMDCVANGCPAEPDFCEPDDCELATQVLALDADALCADPSVGTFVATSCEAPIDWLFSNTVRCCCAD